MFFKRRGNRDNISKGKIGLRKTKGKSVNLYKYKDNSIVAENISIYHFCLDNPGYDYSSLYKTARGIQKYHKDLYAKFI